MVTAMDVANFFIDTLKDSDDPLTNARLNKYLYFAQGHSLERLGRPLFAEDFEAWNFGPVIPCIYRAFKNPEKYSPIRVVNGQYDRACFRSDEIELFFDVIGMYDVKSTHWMINETHRADGPWAAAAADGKQNSTITKESMKAYFSKEPLPRTFAERLSNVKTVGYHDSEGHLILPADWDD